MAIPSTFFKAIFLREIINMIWNTLWNKSVLRGNSVCIPYLNTSNSCGSSGMKRYANSIVD